ncbi:MAG: DUF3443 domain-containing protein [Rhodocyclaceae bacterium]|nr:MAG: DUF3443 domain-containing protein [Rhodocyclaceae bacterium]
MKRQCDILLVACMFGAMLVIAGCGGGGGSGAPSSGNSSPPTSDGAAQNVAVVTVGGGPANRINLLFVTVIICAPGDSTACQAVDNVLVDTASTGLRIFASQLTVPLQPQTDSGGNPLAACGQFADGTVWGSMKLADVKIAGETAKAVPIQLIADPAFAAVPTNCSGIGALRNTIQAFGASGVLGVSVFRQDCGAACERNAIPGTYYACAATGCKPAALATGKQLQNPVALFGQNNNGVIIDLPAVAAEGAATVSGSLIFGIGTQSNNGLGNALVLPVDPTRGTFTTLYANRFYTGSFIDSGSNALFFNDGNSVPVSSGGTTAMPFCKQTFSAGFFCPLGTQTFSAMNQGSNAVIGTVGFSVANAESLFTSNPGHRVFGNLAGPVSGTAFDWGLPFYFGRRVYTAIEGKNTPGGVGPYVAY